MHDPLESRYQNCPDSGAHPGLRLRIYLYRSRASTDHAILTVCTLNAWLERTLTLLYSPASDGISSQEHCSTIPH